MIFFVQHNHDLTQSQLGNINCTLGTVVLLVQQITKASAWPLPFKYATRCFKPHPPTKPEQTYLKVCSRTVVRQRSKRLSELNAPQYVADLVSGVSLVTLDYLLYSYHTVQNGQCSFIKRRVFSHQMPPCINQRQCSFLNQSLYLCSDNNQIYLEKNVG